MKKTSLIFVLFLIFTSPIAAEGEIVVPLSVETKLTPVHIQEVKETSSSYNGNYLQKVLAILAYDWSYNGLTRLSSSREGAEYLFIPSVEEKKLNIEVVDKEHQKRVYQEDITLEGDLNQDRVAIHFFSDHLHKALFHQKGIYTTKILYSYMAPKKDKKGWKAEIYQCDWDGANSVRVTDEDSYCITPAFVPPKQKGRATRFVYVSYSSGYPKIFMQDMVDGSTQRLSYLKGNQFMPAVSLRGNYIAFISDVASNPDLFIQRFDPNRGTLGKPRQIFSCHSGR